ncbi:MAG: lipoyl synthase [Chlorobi bacterium]|nr:lipoyl synthase [Chlorobiota bacterium]
MNRNIKNTISKPVWLKTKLPTGKIYVSVKDIVNSHQLNTICQSGNCPNMGECWGAGTATLMILGDICTRSCQFCAVKTGKPNAVDLEEPQKVANSVKLMKLKHCVLTSVDRDDLEDGGSTIWAKTVKAIYKISPNTTIETLIPDFQGIKQQLNRIISVAPEIVSHNLETVRRLTKQVRIQAKYDRSLEVLQYLKQQGMRTKSGIMVGLGETNEEVIETMHDLKNVGCDILTIGQYLQPTPKHLPVHRFVTPDEFAEYKKIGLHMGFKVVESGPLVRSSYHAEKHLYDEVVKG